MPFKQQTRSMGGALRPQLSRPASGRPPLIPPRATLLSLALLAAFAAWTPSARADNECGLPAGGTANCTDAPNPYALGITYNTATTLSVNVAGSVIVSTNAPALHGLRVTGTGAGALQIQLDPGANITTTGDASPGTYLDNQGLGSSILQSGGAVTTFGANSHGLHLESSSVTNTALHNLRLNANGSVDTAGGTSHGLRAHAAGAARIQVELLDTARVGTMGNSSHGVDAFAIDPGGRVNVFTGSATTIAVQGNESIGIQTEANGQATTDASGRIDATGQYGIGIFTSSWTGNATVEVRSGARVMGGWQSTPDLAGPDLNHRSAGVVISGASSTLNNLGTIGSASDRAVMDDFILGAPAGGNLTLTNRGTITGFVQLAGGGTNLFINSPGGLFEVRRFADTDGDGVRDTQRVAGSDFGNGATSSFVNIGELRLGAVAGAATVDTTDYYVPTTGVASTPLDNSFYRLDRAGVLQGQLTNLGTFRHRGIIDLRGAAVGNTLVITSNAAAGGPVGTGTFISDSGELILNAVLNDGVNSHADMLIVDRVQAGISPTRIYVDAHASSLGALTPGNGIQLIEVRDKTASDAGAFILGSPVASGAYDYQLFHNGVGADAADGNWYLRSFLVLASGATVPTYRAATPVYMAVPALASRLGLAMMGNYHDRLGDDRVRAPERSAGLEHQAGWGRLWGQSGETGRRSGSAQRLASHFQDRGPAYDYDLSGLQVGMDLDRRRSGEGAVDTTGVYLSLGHIKGSVDAVLGGSAGNAKLEAYTLGGYWTRKTDGGAYIDAAVQATYTKGQAAANDGQRIRTRGWSQTASIEGGLAHAVGHGWTVESQAQLVLQHMDLDGDQDAVARVAYERRVVGQARLGARVWKSWRSAAGLPQVSWGRFNLGHALGAKATTSFSDVSGQNTVHLSTALGGVWGQFQVGHSAQLSAKASAFASLDYSLALDGSKGHALGARVGIQLAW